MVKYVFVLMRYQGMILSLSFMRAQYLCVHFSKKIR